MGKAGRNRRSRQSGSRAQGEPDTVETLQRALRAAAIQRLAGDSGAARARARELARDQFDDRAHVADRAVAQLLLPLVTAMWSRGWLPEDVYQMAQRNASEHAASLVADLIADEFDHYPAATTHPVWFDQLTRIQARRWWDTGRPHLSQWADRSGLDRATALLTVIELLAVFITMPRLPEILPLPGTASTAPADSGGGVDEGMLSKVRALLAKAESTSFPDEAEALSAKAQELMSRYAIERAMLDRDDHAPALASARRIWLDNPYIGAKCLLAANVAAANRCRTVSYEKLGFVTVLGGQVDLDTVELLTTSLMVQATKAMIAAGRHVTRTGQSRTRSFRQSFLLAYATRIGERLRESAASSLAAAGADLVPVFAERERVVDDLFASLFPETTSRSYSIGNADGWGAGRAAADRAQLAPERGAVSAR